jgi:glycosyltransferase involved in cell wall biosynthesis
LKLEKELIQAGREPRVLHFVNSLHFGGTEGQLIELIRGLTPKYRNLVASLNPQGAHLQTLQAMGIEPYEVRLASSLARPATLGQILRLGRWLRRQGVEIVHTQDFYSSLVGVPAAKLAGIRAVVGRLDLAHFLTFPQRLALAAVTRGADGVVANAEAIRKMLVSSERLPAGRIRVIRNGIDLSRFDRQGLAPVKKPLPPLGGRLVIVHVANMVHPVKAQEDLLQAFKELLPGRPEALLLLVGDGWRRPMLEKLAGTLGVAGKTCFLGRRPDVPAILHRCDIGVLCSSAEGLSNAIIEGMAAGLPMVVTDAGGNKELVQDGVSGFVVPVHSPSLLKSRLDALAASQVLRVKMGKAGRDFVERELGVERLVACHDALYRSLLAGPQPL